MRRIAPVAHGSCVAACQHQATVTAGAVFDEIRTPLRVAGSGLVSDQPEANVNVLGPPRVFGLGSYQIAWAMLHRFRRATIHPGRGQLKGVLEVDEIYMALTDHEDPPVKTGCKRSTSKLLVAVAVELLNPRDSAVFGCVACARFWRSIGFRSFKRG